MANGFYANGLKHFALGNVDWVDDDIKVVLIDTGSYTVDLDDDEFLDDIPGGAIIATSDDLANKAADAGALTADDITIEDVSGSTVEAAVVYKDTGSAATSPLLVYQDSPTGGFPLTPNGSDVLIDFPSGVVANLGT